MVSRAAQRGAIFLALLFAVAIVGGALSASASLWSGTQQRERETQLLWAGEQFRQALVAYAQAAGAGAQAFPRTLDDLLLDPRSAAPRRFLRRIYDDPMTRSTDWGVVRNERGLIVGVHSRSEARPMRRANFAPEHAGFEDAATYAEWRFMAVREPRLRDRRPSLPGGAASGSAPPTSRPDPEPPSTPVGEEPQPE
jgi:type II secretory pathway pseudopilin PulG